MKGKKERETLYFSNSWCLKDASQEMKEKILPHKQN